MSEYLGFEPTEKEKGYYFISYNSEDRDSVGKFLETLRNYEIDLWYDYGITYGDKWEETISKKIRNSKGMLLFLSKEIFNKVKNGRESFVYSEYRIAKALFGKNYKIYIVFMDNITIDDIPDELTSWWISINDYQGFVLWKNGLEKTINELVSTLDLDKKSTDIDYSFMETRSDVDGYFYPEAPDYEDEINTHKQIADLYVKIKNYPEAIKSYKRIVNLYQKLAEENPDSYNLDLAESYHKLALFYFRIKCYDKSEKFYLEELEISRKLADENPRKYVSCVINSLDNLAFVYEKFKQFEDAEKLYLETLEIHRRLADKNPNKYALDVVGSLNHLADLCDKTNRPDEAENYREMAEEYKK